MSIGRALEPMLKKEAEERKAATQAKPGEQVGKGADKKSAPTGRTREPTTAGGPTRKSANASVANAVKPIALHCSIGLVATA